MCQAKPGPRCSNDTAKEWQSAYRSLEAITEQYNKAQADCNKAIEYNVHTRTPESQKLVDGWEKYRDHLEQEKEILQRKMKDAEYAFYSTPQGMERLQNKINETGNKIVKKRDGFMDDETGDWVAVSYDEYSNIEQRYILEQAKTHRQRQTEAYHSVNKPNQNGLEKYVTANGLINRAESEKRAVEQSLASAEKDEQKALENCYMTRNSPESIQYLIGAKRSAMLAKIKLVYLNAHLRDLRLFSAQHSPREIIAQP